MGYGHAQYKLGVMYEAEKDVPQNFKMAAFWFKLAAKPSGAKFPYADRVNVISKRMRRYRPPYSRNLSGKNL